jgi:hypothetical protein
LRRLRWALVGGSVAVAALALEGTALAAQTKESVATDRLCDQLFPDANQRTHDGVTELDREASVENISCEGFGAPWKFQVDGGVVCSLVAAAIGPAFESLSTFVDGSCDGAALAADHDVGTVSGVACGMLSDLLHAVPGAELYATGAGVACAFGKPTGTWIASHQERFAAKKVIDDGQCLRYQVLKLRPWDDWQAVACRPNDPGFSRYPKATSAHPSGAPPGGGSGSPPAGDGSGPAGSGPGGGGGRTLGWSAVPLGRPADAQSFALLAVSCAAEKTCMAVGVSEDQSGATTPLAEEWDGVSWSVSGIDEQSGVILRGVSCPTANWCAAIGERGSGAPPPAVAETWDGAGWTERTIPAPPGSQAYALRGISCTSQSHCIAVGDYTDETGSGHALAEDWDGSTWTEGDALAPQLGGASGDANSELRSISCASPSACVAVGEYEDQPADTDPALAESWDGSSWTVEPTPSIADAFQTGLSGVSCSASNSCMAVGSYVIFGNPPPEGNTVSEYWDGSQWHLQSAPVLPNTFSGLGSLSCTSATFCVGLGGGSHGDDTYLALWRGGWAYEAFGSALDGVSCASASYCVAVGSQAAVYMES